MASILSTSSQARSSFPSDLLRVHEMENKNSDSVFWHSRFQMLTLDSLLWALPGQEGASAMKISDLLDFLKNRMRPSHIYQPVLVRTLVDAGGAATIRQLAQALLLQDESQIYLYWLRPSKQTHDH